jgi:type IV secretory pathway TraG/TraD family ATPase VirD4
MEKRGYKEAKAFKGFEQWWHAAQMSAKVYVYCFVSVLIFHLCIPLVYFVVYDSDFISLFLKSVLRFEWKLASIYGGYFVRAGVKIFIYALPVWLLYPILLLRFKGKAKAIVEDEHIRGTKLIADGEFAKEIAKETKTKDAHLLHFGQIPIPWKAENRHFLIIGRPGTGKTTLLNQVLEKLRAREEKVIVYDFKGDYLSTFYDPSKDFIFNPLDIRCMNWCLFSEIEMIPDIDSIATSMIPPSYREDKFWTDAARDIFSSILHYLTITGNRTNQAIWELVSYTEPQMLQLMEDAVMQGVEPARKALGYLQGFGQGSKVASDTLSTMRQYTNCFLYMKHLGNEFSIKKWLDEDGASFLFVSNYANLRDTLKPILSLLIDLAMKHILSMHEDIDRRRFIIIDEFASLQRLTTIVQALEQGRSKGASLWLALQDISQLQKLYGHETAYTISNNCNTILSFAVSDPNSQEYLSRLFGETEILETDESLSMGPSDMRDGLTLQRRRRKEPLLLPSQFGILPDFHFYLKMLSYPVTQSKIQWKGFEKKNQPFTLNPIFSLRGGDEE